MYVSVCELDEIVYEKRVVNSDVSVHGMQGAIDNVYGNKI